MSKKTYISGASVEILVEPYLCLVAAYTITTRIVGIVNHWASLDDYNRILSRIAISQQREGVGAAYGEKKDLNRNADDDRRDFSPNMISVQKNLA